MHISKIKQKLNHGTKPAQLIVCLFLFAIALIMILYYILINNKLNEVIKFSPLSASLKNTFNIYTLVFSASVFFCCLLLIFSVILLNKGHGEGLNTRLHELKKITENITGGIARIAFDGDFSLLFANKGYYDLFRFNKKEYEKIYKNKALTLIHPFDYDYVINEFENKKESDVIVMEYRIIDKFRKVHWILMHCIKQKKENNTYIYDCTFTDICSQKKIEENLELSNQRFSAVLKQSNDILFEIDFDSKRISGIANWTIEGNSDEVFKRIIDEEIINKHNLNKFLELIGNSHKGITNQTIQLKAKYPHDENIWYEVQLTSVYNKENEAKFCVCRMCNIDTQIQEKNLLLEQSLKESMTGLFNKKAGMGLAQKYLNETNEPRASIMIIDIDDFKLVNDQFGHHVGDLVIVYLAKQLKKLFRTNDITARIGGDEFMVFIKDNNDLDFANKKAQNIIDNMQDFKFEHSDQKISVSIGIAFAPQNGLKIEDLLVNADKAMYIGKRNGKGHFEMVSESDDDKEEIE